MDIIQHVQRMLDSYRHFTGKELIERVGSAEEQARSLDLAPFIVVSHGTQDDPILNYGNKIALKLWEVDFETLTKMPSRTTAEPMHRDERAQFMARVKTEGFLSGYRGIRISSTGKRFAIENAVIWNILDETGTVCGQAASFSTWTPV